jgi:hypothetical protein
MAEEQHDGGVFKVASTEQLALDRPSFALGLTSS